MGSDVFIEIFGKIDSGKALEDICDALAEEATVDWCDGVGPAEAFERLVDASSGGETADFTRQDTNNHFEAVTSACEEHGVSYRMSVGTSGEDSYSSIVVWQPGMEKPFECDYNGNDLQLTLTTLKNAAAKGIEGVTKLIEELETKSLIFKSDLKLEVTPEAVAEFEGEDPAP